MYNTTTQHHKHNTQHTHMQKCRPRFVSEVLPNSLKGKESVIFSNIHEIEAFHRQKLLPQLRERGTDTVGAAEVFIEFVS